MMPHTQVISAVAVISLSVYSGYLLGTRSPDEARGGPQDPEAATSPAAPSQAGGPRLVESRRARASARLQPARSQPARRSGPVDNPFDIPAADLQAAGELAEDMAARMDHSLAMVHDAGYTRRSNAGDDPTQVLALRLGLATEVSVKLAAILAEDRARQIERNIAAEKVRLEHTRELLADDRADYVTYLALESMSSRGVPLSEEQQVFHERFRENRAPTPDVGPGAPQEEWYEKPDLLKAMHQHLSAEERGELAKFVAEQQTREQERRTTHAYMRSSAIADRLGLDEGERATLYEYLRKHPDAPNSELAGILSPELRELLPPGL